MDECNNITLQQVKIGEEAIVSRVIGGEGMRRRLSDMGFLPGTRVRIDNRGDHGPVVVYVKGTKIALGHGMAANIYVKLVGKEQAKTIRIAFAGNPNAGKTTIFNALTGSRQKVGNYPGVTIEKKIGSYSFGKYTFEIIDLPGTYSLTAYSQEELVTRNFIIEERPDVVVDIVDASNLERNLFLTTQLMELNIPLVVALNKSDLARSQGLNIDIELLSELFGIPFIPTVGHRRKGFDTLFEEVIAFIEGKRNMTTVRIDYGEEIESAVYKIEETIPEECLCRAYPVRWSALKLLENDSEMIKKVSQQSHGDIVLGAVQAGRKRINDIFSDDAEVLIADKRYGFISGACTESVKLSVESRHVQSDIIDKILLHRVFGLPIFIVFMWFVFQFVFAVAEPLVSVMEHGVALLAQFVGANIANPLLQSLLVDGIINGVGGVLTFLPSILLLFFAIALLEDTGYMARAAFVIDKIMHTIGLHGKSFIPMLIGFGCTVPAVMGTRILEDKKDRLITMLIVPFMSCGARLPVYALLISAFFPAYMAGHILFFLYFFGIVVAVIMAKLFRRFLFPGTSASFVMELPPYRFPAVKGLLVHMWMRAWYFIKKAGTVILVASIILWCLMSFPLVDTDENIQASSRIEQTYAGQVGKVLEPVIKPLGFDWKIGVALVSGLAAKEIVVSTLSQLYQVEDESEESLRDALRSDKSFNPLIALSLMIFVLLYIPCLPALATIWKESSIKWAGFVLAYTTSVAWIGSFLVYQGGRLLGF